MLRWAHTTDARPLCFEIILPEWWTRREFDSQQFDELYDGSGDTRLVLRQYPILSVARVACNPTPVLRVTNTSSANQRANVAVTSTGLTLVRVASGTTTTDSSVTWVGNPTLAAVAAAVTVLDNGWSASVADPAYNLRASADLFAPQGALNARDVQAELKLHLDELSDFEIDANRGWLLRRLSLWGWWGFGPQPDPFLSGGWVWGPANYRVIYTAGYVTVPEPVQEACAEWVAEAYWQTKANPAFYPDVPSDHVIDLIAPYRRVAL